MVDALTWGQTKIGRFTLITFQGVDEQRREAFLEKEKKKSFRIFWTSLKAIFLFGLRLEEDFDHWLVSRGEREGGGGSSQIYLFIFVQKDG